jgi:GH25 family lysozyme M1 (1,4-beta-N-acetylmuramidase)
MALKGIDISHWQPLSVAVDVDYDFVICKLSDGTYYHDVQGGIARANKALARGKKIGFYHYAETGSAASEADYFAKNFAPFVGKAIPALDYEGDSLKNGREWVRAFVRRFKEKTGVIPWVYASLSPYNTQDLIGLSKDEGFGIWVARYPNNAPQGYSTPEPPIVGAAAYQYTSTGRLAGYAGNLDLDVFYGDAAAWDRYCTPAENAPTPTPAKSIDELAQEVVAGKWGNGEARKQSLAGAGYDYNAVQTKVNALMAQNAPAPSVPIKAGDRVIVIVPRDVKGTKLHVSGIYDVIQIRGDGAVVIGKGKVVTAAMPAANVQKV